jgi:hypothetical protein
VEEVKQPENEEQKVILDEAAKAAALKKQAQVDKIDKKNAAGAARDLKKNEAIEWRDHPTLNLVTKASIDFYEDYYNFDDFMVERTQQEATATNKEKDVGLKKKKKKLEGEDQEMSEDEEFTEEEDDEDEIAR